MENKHTIGDLRQMQSLPLSSKIRMTEYRIRQWYEEFDGQVYVSFSGGKDSTVLLDIARKLYPDIPAIWVNTGLEYPSVRQFALSKENVTELRPTMNFRDVIIKYGYPIISKEVSRDVFSARRNPDGKTAQKFVVGSEFYKKYGGNFGLEKWSFLLQSPFLISNKCCNITKKRPLKKDKRKPILATMACESELRTKDWLERGCNVFDNNNPISKPMSFWKEQDVLQYIHENDLPIADAYGQVVVKNDGIDGQINIHDYFGDYRGCRYEATGCKRTGCVFCLFGIRQDLDRIINLSEQEPKLCDYVMRGGEFSEIGMWQPSKDGLGYWFVLEWLNVHGNLKIGIPNRDYYMDKYCTEENRKYLEANQNERANIHTEDFV